MGRIGKVEKSLPSCFPRFRYRILRDGRNAAHRRLQVTHALCSTGIRHTPKAVQSAPPLLLSRGQISPCLNHHRRPAASAASTVSACDPPLMASAVRVTELAHASSEPDRARSAERTHHSKRGSIAVLRCAEQFSTRPSSGIADVQKAKRIRRAGFALCLSAAAQSRGAGTRNQCHSGRQACQSVCHQSCPYDVMTGEILSSAPGSAWPLTCC